MGGKALTLKTIFQAIDKMSGPTKTITSKMEKYGKVVQGVGKGLAIAGAATVAAGVAVGRAAIAFAERGDDIARNAGILGLTASAYQELSYAANMADIEQEAFASATKKLTKNMGDLNLKTGTLYDVLSKTNPALAVQLHHAKDTDEAFSLVARAIAKETDTQKRAQLAQAAFGKTGQDLIPMMEDLVRLRQEARDSGSIISDEDIASASALDDSLKRIKAAASGPLNMALAMVADRMTPIIDKMTAWIRDNRELIGQRIDQLFQHIGGALNFMTSPGVLKGIAALAVGIKAVGIASAVFGAGNPMVLAIAGIAALITLIVTNWDKITGFFDQVAGVNSKQGGSGSVADYGIRGSAIEEMYGSSGADLAPVVSSSSESVSRSEVAVNFGNVPAGTKIKQTGKAPGVTLSLGRQMQFSGGGSR